MSSQPPSDPSAEPPSGPPSGPLSGPRPGQSGASPSGGGPPTQAAGGTPPGPPPRQVVALGGGRRPPWWRRPAVLALVAAVLVLGGVLGGVFGTQSSSSTKTAQTTGQQIVLQPAGESGPDPFTGSVASGSPKPSASAPAPTATSSTGAGTTRSGSDTGLFGGSKHLSSCDVPKLAAFLAANPDKGRAWAGVEGIDPSGISRYLDSLTPVVLRSDTRVTNHGFQNGAATSFQSVLQAGTAVLVDTRGVPRVRCACGNPLLPPAPAAPSSFTGTAWEGFHDQDVVTVLPAATQINILVLIDVDTGAVFGRPTGTTGDNDRTPTSSASASARPSRSASASASTSASAPSTASGSPSAATSGSPSSSASTAGSVSSHASP